MKIEEVKEIKEILPPYFQSSVNILEKQREQGSFTAWSVGNSDYFISSYYADEALPNAFLQPHPLSSKRSLHPYFDLASLTKPLFLNAFLRHKWDGDYQAFLTQFLFRFHWVNKNWNSKLFEFIKNNPQLDLNTFISHKSDFDAWTWIKFFISVRHTESVKTDFLSLLLKHYKKKNTHEYSDLNYMFLTLLLESLFDINDWKKEILKLNKTQNTHFFHVSVTPEKSKFAIPSYPYISISPSRSLEKNKRFGPVHDTNANLFTTLPPAERIVSGHAGFFGNITDVSRGLYFLKETQPFITTEDFQDKFIYGLNHTLNPDKKSLGHLGYTGTAFWFNLQKTRENNHDSFILLTNRTARRFSKNSDDIPQVCIITDVQQNIHYYFFLYKKKVEMFSEKEFLKKSKEYFKKREKIWNDSIIFEYDNLTELRNTLAKQIC